MVTQTVQRLAQKKCRPCEGGIPKYTRQQAEEQVSLLEGWRLDPAGQRIQKHWQARDFNAGIDFLNLVAVLAEEEGHHPDVHLEGYRHVWIELWTHAIGGLSENDFIMAAKIDRLPVQLREAAIRDGDGAVAGR
jgi:4a-hydroxytetrahydrobiopterin dehydratase